MLEWLEGISLCLQHNGKESHDKRTNELAECILLPALVMTAASAALSCLAGQRGRSPGGCDATPLAFGRTFGSFSRLRALPRLDPETRTSHRQNCPGHQYGAGGFVVGLEASILRGSEGYPAEVYQKRFLEDHWRGIAEMKK